MPARSRWARDARRTTAAHHSGCRCTRTSRAATGSSGDGRSRMMPMICVRIGFQFAAARSAARAPHGESQAVRAPPRRPARLRRAWRGRRTSRPASRPCARTSPRPAFAALRRVPVLERLLVGLGLQIGKPADRRRPAAASGRDCTQAVAVHTAASAGCGLPLMNALRQTPPPPLPPRVDGAFLGQALRDRDDFLLRRFSTSASFTGPRGFHVASLRISAARFRHVLQKSCPAPPVPAPRSATARVSEPTSRKSAWMPRSSTSSRLSKTNSRSLIC